MQQYIKAYKTLHLNKNWWKSEFELTWKRQCRTDLFAMGLCQYMLFHIRTARW